jgi:hypothetical protein
MRVPIPPAWRQLLRGGLEPWQLAGVFAAVAGAAWLMSPYSTLQKVAEKRQELVGRTPNAWGRAVGYTAHQLRDPVQDPIEVLTMRAAVARAGTTAPTYRGGRASFFREYLASPPEVTWPMPRQNLNALGAQAPFRGIPIQASPAVSRTAADVLHAQLDARRGGDRG